MMIWSAVSFWLFVVVQLHKNDDIFFMHFSLLSFVVCRSQNVFFFGKKLPENNWIFGWIDFAILKQNSNEFFASQFWKTKIESNENFFIHSRCRFFKIEMKPCDISLHQLDWVLRILLWKRKKENSIIFWCKDASGFQLFRHQPKELVKNKLFHSTNQQHLKIFLFWESFKIFF